MVYKKKQMYLIAYILRMSKWREMQDDLKHIFKNDFLNLRVYLQYKTTKLVVYWDYASKFTKMLLQVF